MRIIDRIISFIFSLIMLVFSIVLILVGFRVIEPQLIIDILSTRFFSRDIINAEMFNVVAITGIVLLLASLKTTIFLSLFKIKSKAPIIVKTKNGEIQIAQETILNTAKSATLAFENVREVQNKMVKKGRGVVIYEIIQVYVNANIRELTADIQESVKNVVFSTTGVSVYDVNIKIKNVYTGKRKDEISLRNSRMDAQRATLSAYSNAYQNSVFNVDEAVKKAEEKETKPEVVEESKQLEEAKKDDTPTNNEPEVVEQVSEDTTTEEDKKE